MPIYTILEEIIKLNPSISHFLIRLYKKTLHSFTDKKGDVDYEWISVNDITSLESKILVYEDKGFMVGLTSMIMSESGIQSLLLLDFSVKQSDEAEKELIYKISSFNKSGDVPYKMDGYLIETNTSYHYIGKYITSKENFRHFLGSSLLFRHRDQDHFVVDDRWIGHQLRHGYGTVRIGHKDGGEYPKVICEI